MSQLHKLLYSLHLPSNHAHMPHRYSHSHTPFGTILERALLILIRLFWKDRKKMMQTNNAILQSQVNNFICIYSQFAIACRLFIRLWHWWAFWSTIKWITLYTISQFLPSPIVLFSQWYRLIVIIMYISARKCIAVP